MKKRIDPSKREVYKNPVSALEKTGYVSSTKSNQFGTGGLFPKIKQWGV
jgi:hypothetical protein